MDDEIVSGGFYLIKTGDKLHEGGIPTGFTDETDYFLIKRPNRISLFDPQEN